MQADRLDQTSNGPELQRLMLGFLGILVIFALLLLTVCSFSVLQHTGLRLEVLMLPAIALLGLLGLAELLMAARSGINRNLRFWLMLVAITALATPLSILLHNVLSTLVESSGGSEEGFFFILALFVSPAVFIVAVIGTFVTLLRMPED